MGDRHYGDFEHFMRSMFVFEPPHDPAWYTSELNEWDLARDCFHSEQFRDITKWYIKNGDQLAIWPRKYVGSVANTIFNSSRKITKHKGAQEN